MTAEVPLLPVLARQVRVGQAIEAIASLRGSSAAHPRKLATIGHGPGPQKFLAQVLGSLRTAGIVASTRGSHGGYWLVRPVEEITVLAVFEALAPGDGAPPSPSGALWTRVEGHLRDQLAELTVADVAAR